MVLTLIQQGLGLRPQEKRALCGKMVMRVFHEKHPNNVFSSSRMGRQRYGEQTKERILNFKLEFTSGQKKSPRSYSDPFL